MTDRYTRLRRPWRLPAALPCDWARRLSTCLACGVKGPPPDISPPHAGSVRFLAHPANRAAAKATSHLGVAAR
jgi:hypothetical protein